MKNVSAKKYLRRLADPNWTVIDVNLTCKPHMFVHFVKTPHVVHNICLS
jgi:hypothetical protein